MLAKVPFAIKFLISNKQAKPYIISPYKTLAQNSFSETLFKMLFV